jgi:hypothetical protein
MDSRAWRLQEGLAAREAGPGQEFGALFGSGTLDKDAARAIISGPGVAWPLRKFGGRPKSTGQVLHLSGSAPVFFFPRHNRL